MTADQIKVWIKQMELYEQDRLGHVCIEVINILLDEIDNLTREVNEWYSVFGHLSKDADEAGNLINEGLQERDDELQRTRHSYNVLSNQYDDLLVKHNKMLFALRDIQRLRTLQTLSYERYELMAAVADAVLEEIRR